MAMKDRSYWSRVVREELLRTLAVMPAVIIAVVVLHLLGWVR